MSEVLGAAMALVAAGFLSAMGLIHYLLRYRLSADISGERLVLRLPLLGEVETAYEINCLGLRIEEARNVLEQAEKIGRLVDLDVVMDYARRFGITYIGFEGDAPGGDWTPGRLAYSTIQGGFTICLNPDLDLPAVAKQLSEQLQRPVLPADVYPFLFFHEVGHSTRAGNQCYISAQINHSLSGGRRTARRRRELRRLHTRIERYADNFAWGELLHYRARNRAGLPEVARALLTSGEPADK
jgi:hypothetical protein